MSALSDNRERIDDLLGVSSTFKKRRKLMLENNAKILGRDTEETSLQDKTAKQIANYKTRLEASGIEEEDKRGPIEKFLNLPDEQNIIFDAFDLINRPFNALKGGIQEVQEGGDFLEGARSGLGIGENAGYEEYYAGDILRNLGVDDTKLFTNPINGDDVSVADIAGTVIDIFGDPMDLALWASTVPTGGATAPLAIANTVDNVADVAKAAKTVDNAVDAVKTADKIADAAKATTTVRKSTLEVLAGLGAKGVKKTAGLADTGLTKGLQKIDNIRAASWAKKGATAKTIDKELNSLYDLYSGFKKGVTSTIDYAKALPGNIINKTRETDAAVEGARLRAASRIENLHQATENYAKTTKAYNSVEEVDRAINRLIESHKTRDNDLAYLFKKAANSKKNIYTIQGTTESIDNAFKELNKIDRVTKANIISNPTSIGNGVSEIKIFKKEAKDLTSLRALADNEDVAQVLRKINVTRPSKMPEEAAAEVAKAKKLLETDKDFRDLYERAIRIGPDFAEDVYKETGGKVDFREIANRPGYGRKELEEYALRTKGINLGSEYNTSTLKGNKNAFGTGNETEFQKYNVDEAEVIRDENIGKGIKGRRSDVKAIINNLPENKYVRLKSELAEKRKTLIRKNATFEANIKKAKLDLETTTKLSQSKKLALDGYTDVVTDEAKKALNKLANPAEGSSYVKAANNYTNKYNRLSKELDKLTKEGLSTTEIKKITSNISKYQDDIIKAQNRVDIENAKLLSSVTTKMEKQAADAVNNASKLTKESLRLSAKEASATSKVANLEAARESMVERLTKDINTLELQVENANPNLPKNIQKRADDLERIKELNEEISILKSVQGKKLFTNSYFGGITDFVNHTASQAKTIQIYDNIALKAGLEDENVIRFLGKADVNKKVPTGYKELSSSELSKISNYLGSYSKLVPEETVSALKAFNGKVNKSARVVIDQDAYDLLKINEQLNDANIGLFLKTVNGFTNTFRKYSTFSIGYQLRNLTGNFSNAVLSGVPMGKLTREFAHADKLLRNDNMWKLLNKATDGTSVLTKAEKADVELVKDFLRAGFLGQGAKVRDLQEVLSKVQNTSQYRNKAKKLIDDVFKLNVKANEWLDAHSRLAVLAYARKNPSYVAKLGASSPIDAVKKVLFDPTNMSAIERNVFKKFIPFYTFTKQNMMFQMSNMLKNTSKYNELYKAFNMTYDSLDENQYRDYQKSTMNIPIYTDEEGNTVTLKTNLPASDVGEWFNSPEDFIRRAVSSSTPLIKTPVEIATGVDPFTGYESDKTPLEHLAGVFGIQNLTTNVPERIQKVSEGGTVANQFADLLPSVATYNDAEKIASQNQYQEYLDYQAYIKSLKEQGIEVPTLAELEEQGIDIDAIRDRITGTNSALKRLKKQREELMKLLQ